MLVPDDACIPKWHSTDIQRFIATLSLNIRHTTIKLVVNNKDRESGLLEMLITL